VNESILSKLPVFVKESVIDKVFFYLLLLKAKDYMLSEWKKTRKTSDRSMSVYHQLIYVKSRHAAIEMTKKKPVKMRPE
jgi:hypothetical protein